jgi:hypothetical protein
VIAWLSVKKFVPYFYAINVSITMTVIIKKV